MRLPYVPNPPRLGSEPEQAILQRVQERRGERGLQELDLTLLHSPPVADGWNSFLGAIRTRSSLPTSVREVAICRVAVLNRAWYEWMHHAPILRDARDLDENGVQYLLECRPRACRTSPELPGAATMAERYLAVMDYTDAMTLDVAVPDPVFEGLRKSFNEREVVEITATIAAYNCVSRFLVALDVGEKNKLAGPEADGV